MEITYENISPLLKSEVWENGMVRCSFQAEGKEPVQAIGQVPLDQNEIMKNAVKSSVKQGLIYSIIRGVSRTIGSIFGGVGGAVADSAVSSVGYSVVSAKMNNPQTYQPQLTPENKKMAVVNAFHTVSNFFRYDEINKKWISAF